MVEYGLKLARSDKSPLYYQDFKDARSETSVSRFEGRVAGRLTSRIPGGAIEPVQFHLTARDGKPFEETIWADNPLQVRYWNMATRERVDVTYPAEQRISIPLYVAHWLANPNEKDLKLTCEYGPYPWEETDEPEFFSFGELIQFANENDLIGKMIEASKNFL